MRAVLLLLAGCLICWFFSKSQPMFVTEDGRDYLSYGNLIYQNEWNQINAGNRVTLRSPLYPWLIAAARLFFADPLAAIRGLHIGAAFFAILAMMLLLRQFVSLWLVLITAAVTLIQARVFYFCVLTEWLAICLVLVLAALAVRFIKRPGKLDGVFMLIVSALAILLRSALSPLVLVLPALVLSSYGRLSLGAVRVFTVTGVSFCAFLPIVLYNWIVLGSPSVSPLGGIAVFGMSTLLPDEGIDKDLGADAELFTGEFRNLRYQRVDSKGNRYPVSPEAIVNRNMFEVGDGIRAEHGWDYLKFSQIGGEYARAVIARSKGGYLRLVLREWLRSFAFIELQAWLTFLIFSGCFILAAAGFKNRAIFQGALCLVVFHMLQVFFCVLVHPAIYRHFAVTYYVTLGAMYLAIGSYFVERYTSRSRCLNKYTSVESSS